MANRNTLYRKFGPMLPEALLLMTLEAINVLRIHAGLQPFTKDQAEQRLETILEGLPPYDWMNGPQ